MEQNTNGIYQLVRDANNNFVNFVLGTIEASALGVRFVPRNPFRCLEDSPTGFVDRLIGRKSLGYLRLEEREVRAGSVAIHVLASNTALHCEIVFRA